MPEKMHFQREFYDNVPEKVKDLFYCFLIKMETFCIMSVNFLNINNP